MRSTNVVFPAPVGPTTAVMWPAGIVADIERSVSTSAVYWKLRFSMVIACCSRPKSLAPDGTTYLPSSLKSPATASSRGTSCATLRPNSVRYL
jgi:hypothetical protein